MSPAASTRYLLFFRTLLLANLLLASLYVPEIRRALGWIQAAFPVYAACALALYWLEKRGRLAPSAAQWSFLLDLGFAASAALVLPGDSMGFFIAFFLVILSSTLLRKPAFSFLLAAAAGIVYWGLTQPGDHGRLLKTALLIVIAFFSTFMTTYAGQIERQVAEPYERRLAWLERLSLVGRSLAGVLHEVKTPLGTILLSVENARRLLRRGESAEEELDIIAQETRRASEILVHFLEFTRPVEIELSPLALRVPIEKVASAMRARLEERGVALELRLRAGVLVPGSERHLVQAFTNLFMNAIQAMPSGGTLTVSQELEGSMAVVRVADTGAGMSEAELDSLLSPPLSPSAGARGFGLGLGIARWIVEKHRGELRLESPGPGKGATAVVRLPACPKS